MITPYLASTLVNVFKPEIKFQVRLLKDLNSNKMNNFLTNASVPVTLYSKMLTFRDTKKSFQLDRDLLKAITICKFNVGHSNPQDQKTIYEFAKEMNCGTKRKGPPSNRDKPIIKLLNSSAIMVSGISNTVSLSSDPHEIYDRLK